jgi:hypothetical protein
MHGPLELATVICRQISALPACLNSETTPSRKGCSSCELIVTMQQVLLTDTATENVADVRSEVMVFVRNLFGKPSQTTIRASAKES